MKSAVFSTLFAGVAAHSYPLLPAGRNWKNINGNMDYCLTDETGATAWAGTPKHWTARNCKAGCDVCTKDAMATDIMHLKPSTYRENPCWFTREEGNYDPHDQKWGTVKSHVAQGDLMCVSWAGNGHTADPTNNRGGGVRFAISKKKEPTMDDFDDNVITYIPFHEAEGALLRLPEDLEPGEYTMLFSWDWYTGWGSKLEKFKIEISVIFGP